MHLDPLQKSIVLAWSRLDRRSVVATPTALADEVRASGVAVTDAAVAGAHEELRVLGQIPSQVGRP